MNYLSNSKGYRRFKLLLLSIVLTMNLPMAAQAYSVQDAIIDAHENNDDIMSKLYQLRSTRLNSPLVFTNEFMPTVTATATYNQVDYQNYRAVSTQRKYINSRGFTITQPLFNSGGSIARLKSATANVDAAEATFMAQSQALSLTVVQSYEDVIAKRAIYELNIQNLKLAAETREYTQVRFDHGEVTKTDVLQAEANYATAVATEDRALGDMHSSEATFQRLMGRPAPALLDPVNIKTLTLPLNLDCFTDIALQNNPNLIAAKYGFDQKTYDSYAAISNVLPNVSATATTTRSNTPKSISTDGTTYALNLSIPIIPNGGSDFVKIFQSRHNAKQADYTFQETTRLVKENAIQAWSNYKSFLAQLKAQRETITFSEQALEGVREEAKIGTRTTLDVLNAQTALFQSKVGYTQIEQNLISAVYNIVTLTGEIDTIDIEYRE